MKAIPKLSAAILLAFITWYVWIDQPSNHIDYDAAGLEAPRPDTTLLAVKH